jgi:hypothetical protein
MDKDKANKLSYNQEIRIEWGEVYQTMTNCHASRVYAINDSIRQSSMNLKTENLLSRNQRSNQL